MAAGKRFRPSTPEERQRALAASISNFIVALLGFVQTAVLAHGLVPAPTPLGHLPFAYAFCHDRDESEKTHRLQAQIAQREYERQVEAVRQRIRREHEANETEAEREFERYLASEENQKFRQASEIEAKKADLARGQETPVFSFLFWLAAHNNAGVH